VPLTSTTLLDWLSSPKSHAGVRVTEKNSLGMPAVWRAVNLIAGTCASLPLHAYRSDDDVRVPAGPGQAGARLLSAPHPDMTSYELWESVYAHLLLWGNAYLQKLRNPLGAVTELWLIHPSLVKVGRASDMTKIYVINGDEDNPRSDDSILHIPGFGYDGVSGVSPIQLHRQGIGLSMAAEEYGARLFGSGSLMSGILQVDRQLNQDQADRLKANWKAKVGGLDKAHEVAVLDNGAKFQQLSIPPQDAQFIESRRFQISEVARIFGVPPHMLMDTEKSTSWGAGIEQQGIGFVVYTLRPWLTRVEQRVSRMLQPSTVYAKYSVEGLLRGDTAARSEFYTKMWNIGAFSTNEIRKLEDQPPVDNGDIRYRPLNMGVLGEADPQPAIPASVDSQEAPA
jgi:HK97 family phage portal protein